MTELTLVDLARDLITTVDQLKTADHTATAVGRLKNETRSVVEATNGIRAALDGLDVAKRHGYGSITSAVSREVIALCAGLQKLQSSLADSGLDIPSGDVSEVRQSLQQFRQAVDFSLQQIWGLHRVAALSADQTELLTALMKVEMLASGAQRLMGIDRELRGSRFEQYPRSEVEYQEFTGLLEQRVATWKAFPVAAHADVLRFLQAAGTHGATLEELTADVFSWLDENHLVGDFRIMAGKPT